MLLLEFSKAEKEVRRRGKRDAETAAALEGASQHGNLESRARASNLAAARAAEHFQAAEKAATWE